MEKHFDEIHALEENEFAEETVNNERPPIWGRYKEPQVAKSTHKIYAITCFSKLEEENGWPKFGAMAFMGWFSDRKKAISAVKVNACDINETIYNYAVIEEIEEGLYAYPRKRWLFKYSKTDDRYYGIEEPSFLKHIANIL